MNVMNVNERFCTPLRERGGGVVVIARAREAEMFIDVHNVHRAGGAE
jgi:hypothetical protein